jgi:hypothetical protein
MRRRIWLVIDNHNHNHNQGAHAMIDFARLYNFPHEPDGTIAVRLHGRPIGTMIPSADGRSAHVIVGIGIEGEGDGFVYDRDRFGRPQCIYRAAAELILADGGHPDRIID